MTEPVPTPAEVVDAMHAAFRLSDLEGIARYWADEVSYEAPGVRLSGKPARVLAENVWLDAFSNNGVETTHRYIDGDEIVDFAIMSGQHTGPLALPGGQTLAATGVRVSGPYVARYRIVDGRVTHQQVVYDRLALVEQLHGGAA
jgi:hypothetical protein